MKSSRLEALNSRKKNVLANIICWTMLEIIPKLTKGVSLPENHRKK